MSIEIVSKMSNTHRKVTAKLSRAEMKEALQKANKMKEAQDVSMVRKLGGTRAQQSRKAPEAFQVTECVKLGKQYDRTGQLKFLVALRQLHSDENAAFLLSPQSNWTYEQRWAVMLKRPDIPAANLGKAALIAELHRLDAQDMSVSSGTRTQLYNYAPSFTSPQRDAWLEVCAHLPQSLWLVAKASSRIVFVPPLITNMVEKMKKRMTKSWAKIPPELTSYATEVIGVNRDRFQQLMQLPRREKQTANTIIEDVLNWLSYKGTVFQTTVEGVSPVVADEADFILNDTSAGMPWMQWTRPNGRPWGHCHAPALIAALIDDKDSVMKRLLKLFLQESKGGVIPILKRLGPSVRGRSLEESSARARKAMLDAGAAMYKRIMSQRTARADDGGHDISDFWVHMLWMVLAGNVKPVTPEEVEAGKPDRAVYSSSAVLRLLTLKVGHVLYEVMEHPSFRPHFSFAKGGAARFLLDAAEASRSEFQFTELKLEGVAHEHLQGIEFTNAVSAKPDVQSMDMTMQPEYQDGWLQYKEKAFNFEYGEGHKDARQMLILYIIGFANAATKAPRVLVSNDVVIVPHSLNPSGSAETFLLNEYKSICIREAMSPKFRQTLNKPGTSKLYEALAPPQVGGTHVTLKFHSATGDDQFFLYQLDPLKLMDGSEVDVNERREAGSYFADWTEKLEEIRKKFMGTWQSTDSEGAAVRSGAWTPGAKLIAPGYFQKLGKIVGVDWKPATLTLDRSLTTTPYLGHHLVASDLVGVPQIMAVRPASSVLHMALWPHHRLPKGSPLTHQTYTAIRAVAAYLECAAAYPGMRTTFRAIYDRAVKAAGSIAWHHRDLKGWLARELALPIRTGDMDPVAWLDTLGVNLGQFPTLEAAWFLQTGTDLPTDLSGSEEVYVDLDDDLGEFAGAAGQRKLPPLPEVPDDASDAEADAPWDGSDDEVSL